jgi:hypothetical protein
VGRRESLGQAADADPGSGSEVEHPAHVDAGVSGQRGQHGRRVLDEADEHLALELGRGRRLRGVEEVLVVVLVVVVVLVMGCGPGHQGTVRRLADRATDLADQATGRVLPMGCVWLMYHLY